MSRANIVSILAGSFLFCLISAGAPAALQGAEPAAPSPQRPDIVGGTSFPDLYLYTDPVTRSEVWGVRPPEPRQEENASAPIIVSPDIHLPWPAPRGGEGGKRGGGQ